MPDPLHADPLRADPLHADLEGAELEILGRLVQASNATFLGRLDTGVHCVYKPTAGEKPLWDFPTHTLAFREVAAYRVSSAIGYDLVPVTELIEGPYGPGSLQVWVGAVEGDEDALPATVGDDLVDLVPSDEVPAEGWFEVLEGLDAVERPVSLIHADDPRLRRMALFDAVINNTDRKGQHILAHEGRLYGVDHGVSFHVEPKLRTILWGWSGVTFTDEERALIEQTAEHAPDVVDELLTEPEIEALFDRCAHLLATGHFPLAGYGWPSVPWPPL